MPDRIRRVPMTVLAELNPKTALPSNTECSFIGMEDVSEDGAWTRKRTRSSRDAAGYTPFRDGDVLFAKITPCMENGKGAPLDGLIGGFGFGSTEFHVLRARPGTASGYIAQWTRAPVLRLKAEAFMTGSAGQRRVQSEFFGKFEIPAFPLGEQRRVAEILDTFDNAIRSTEQLIAKLQQMKRGLLHDLLTRGIDERGALRASHGPHLTFADTQLGRFPTDWIVERLGVYLIAIEAGDSPDVPDRPAAAGEWGVLKVSAVRPDGFQGGENKAVTERALVDPNNEIRDGDLLITRANTPQLVGLACLVSGRPQRLLLSDKTLRLIVDRSKASPEFACLLLQSPIARAQIEVNGTGSSGSMKNISQVEIRDLLLPWPSLAEQRRICERSSPVAERIAEEAIELGKLHLLKSGMMDDLLTGRVRVKVDSEDAA